MLGQENGPGPFKVTPTSAVEEIKELPLSLVDILVTPTPQGRRDAWSSLSQAHHQRSTIPTLPRDRLGHASGWDVGLTHSHCPVPGDSCTSPQPIDLEGNTPFSSLLPAIPKEPVSFHSNSPVPGAIP